MKRTLKACFLMSALLLTNACSDLKKSSLINRPIESSRFNVGCELDPDQFRLILEKDISYQIDCLSKSLDMFMRLVRTNKPGYLSRTALEEFILNNVADFDPKNTPAIKSVFDISHLLFGESPEYLSPSSVRKLINFLHTFNKNVIKIYPSFQSKEQTPIGVHNLQRSRVTTTVQLLSKELSDIYNRTPRNGELHKLDIVALLESFSTGDNTETFEKLKAVLFIKKLFLGGERNEINHLELHNLIGKLTDMSFVVFDLMRIQYIAFDQGSGQSEDGNQTPVNPQRSQFETLQQDLSRIEPLLYYTSDSKERLFSLEELAEATASIFDPEDFPDLRKYPNELLQLKMLVMSTARWQGEVLTEEDKWVHPGELKILLEHANELANRGAVYHRMYEFFNTLMASPQPLSLNASAYELHFPGNTKYLREFIDIVNKYRYYLGKKPAPFYSREYRRNPEGVVQIGILQYAIDLAFRRYGAQISATEGYGADLDQMKNIFKIFRKVLEGEGLITEGRITKTNENMTLLTTLFQHQSNGDGVMSVNELAEFGTTVLTSFKTADKMELELHKNCPLDTYGRIIDLNCYRKDYIPTLCRHYKDHYPRFFESLDMVDCDDVRDPEWNEDFLKSVEGLARTCTIFKSDKKDVPINADDYFTINVVMMSIEGTIARYDANFNNRLDPSEVRTAYNVAFRTAVEALVEKKAAVIAKLPFNLGGAISRKIYYHLIKYRDIPRSVGQYFRLLTIGATTARRDTIAAVLKVIAEESASGPPVPGDDPPFDCEKLRNPVREEDRSTENR